MPLLPHEVTKTCPYNSSHQILESKMTVHLIRCRRSNLDKKVDICPFNSSHHVKSEEMEHHMRICKDRKLLEDCFIQQKNKVAVAAVAAVDEENWENDLVEHSYNPLEACKTKKVLMKKEGVTPAERKKFRSDEKIRHQSLPDNNPAEDLAVPMKSLGKLMVSHPKELLTIKPGPRGVAGVSEGPHSKGRGRGRGRKVEKTELKHGVLPSPEARPAPRGVAGVSESEGPRMAGRGRIKWVSRFN